MKKLKYKLFVGCTLFFILPTLLLGQTIQLDQLLNSTKKAIKLETYTAWDKVHYTKEKLSHYDVFIRNINIYDKKQYELYLVNLTDEDVNHIYNKYKNEYLSMYEVTKIRLNYFLKTFTSNDKFYAKKSLDENTVDTQHQKNIAVNQKVQKKSDKNNYKAKYLQAKKLYDKKQYSQAILLFEQLVEVNPNVVNVNFYLGSSYYKLKQYKEASAAFERIIIVEENNLRAKLELAQTYMMLNLNQEALQTFQSVLQNEIPDNVRLNIQKRIEYIKSKEKIHFFGGMLSLGFTLDNNIQNVSNSDSFSIKVDDQTLDIPITDKKYSDLYTTASASFFLNSTITDTQGITNRITSMHQNYKKDSQRLDDDTQTGIEKESKKQLTFHNYNLGYSISNNKQFYSLNFDYSKVSLASESFFSSLGVGFNFQQSFYTKNSFYINGKIFNKSYTDKDLVLDSKTFQILTGQTIHTKKLGNFNFLFILSDERLDSNEKSANKTVQTLIASNIYKLSDNTSLINSFSHYIKDEKQKNPTFNKKREDLNYLFSTGLEYKVKNNFLISTSLRQIQNKSNIEIFSYEKQIFDINFKYFF